MTQKLSPGCFCFLEVKYMETKTDHRFSDAEIEIARETDCLLYTTDAADE